MLKVESLDAEILARYNIECFHSGNAASNSIELPENIVPQGSLKLVFSGDGNEISLAGTRLPTGIINLENDSRVAAECTSQVNLNLWMYQKSRFTLEESVAIFGLQAQVYYETSLSIGKNCLISSPVVMWTSDHHSVIDLTAMEQINFPADIRLADRVWIGQGVTVLKGVEIGEGSIVAACALVNRSIPKTELWGGVPAQCLRKDVSWVSSHPADPHEIEVMARSLGRDVAKMDVEALANRQSKEIASLTRMVEDSRAEFADFRRTVETALGVGWEEIQALKRRTNRKSRISGRISS